MRPHRCRADLILGPRGGTASARSPGSGSNDSNGNNGIYQVDIGRKTARLLAGTKPKA
jgi:hypothetical protein